MATVSAASYDGTQQAPEAIVAGFGRHLAAEALGATELPLPTILGDTQVRVFDSLGTRRFAPLFYVSPGQINFQIPAGTALGEAQVVVNRNGIVAAGRVVITSVAPGLFTANSTGSGVPAALAFRLKGSGAQSYEAREAQSKSLENFKGGAPVVIYTSTAVLVALVIILIILI